MGDTQQPWGTLGTPEVTRERSRGLWYLEWVPALSWNQSLAYSRGRLNYLVPGRGLCLRAGNWRVVLGFCCVLWLHIHPVLTPYVQPQKSERGHHEAFLLYKKGLGVCLSPFLSFSPPFSYIIIFIYLPSATGES